MTRHIFTTRLKCLLRDKLTIFWTMIFPVLLAVLFNLALSNANQGETFQAVDIAIVNNASFQNEQPLKTALTEASTGSSKLFKITLASSAEKAEQMLQQNSISGYLIVVDSQPRLVVSQSGIQQSIIKNFLDSYLQTTASVYSILQNNPRQPEQLLNSIGERRQYLTDSAVTAAAPNNVLNFFYSLIAMACFYGGFFGLREITDIEANLSPLAARISVSPVHKLKAFFSSLSASLLIHLAEIFVLLLFLRYVLQIDFGYKSNYVVLTAIIGSVAGVSFGVFIGALVKKSENIKIGILLGVTMTGSFLAGMMSLDMKYIIAQQLPVLSYLNPVNLLTDAFYSLYYYDTLTRYLLNIGILGIFIVIFCAGTYFIIRRRQYANL